MIAADWARLLAALGFITLVTCQNHVTTIFTDPMSDHSFEHMVYNPNNDNLYIGATNHLYQLRDSLLLRHSFKTGPIKDSPNCPDTGQCSCVSGDCSHYRRKLTNSVSKGLAIHEQGGVLISCWNTLQGHCDKRNLTDITKLITLKSYIVANDANASAILLVAPGPASTAPDSAALYVAATRSSVGIVDGYNDLIHALSSRKLSDFQISSKSITSSTTIKFNTRFFVDYVFGFSSGGFSYFLTVQRHPNTDQYISRIVRVCQQDEDFNSYAEITLECKQGGQNYNLVQAAYAGKAADDLAKGMVISTNEDVLYAVFAISGRGTKVPTKKSAICAYPLRLIRQVFTRNIQECFSGIGNTGPSHVKRIVACTRSGFRIDDNYCGQHNFNQPISSTNNNIQATALKTYDDTLLTSVAVTLTHEYTVALVGTSTGLMRKVVLETTSRAVDYGHVVIDNVRVLPEMAVTDEHVFVLTPNKVSKVRLELCDEYRTCSECLGAGDPYCGWCTLENRCSVRSQCAEAGQTRMRWLPYKNVQCINITTIQPSSVQIEPGQKKDLSLTIQNLPGLAPGGTYKCAFVGYNSRETTTAYKTDKGIDCSTPFPNTLPPIPTGTDHINMTLTVTYNNIDLVSETITFFNCQVHESCTQCTNSRFPCNWCIKNHRCVHQRDDCGPQEKLVNGIMVTEGVTDRHGPSFCPRIMYKDTVIPVPSGDVVQVSVQAINLESFQRPLRCSFNIENGRDVEGELVDRDTINCKPVRFSYPENTGFINVPFRITWGDNKPIDNPTNIQVKVYKCSALGNTCGSCLLLDPNLKCGWCQSDCSIKQTCRSGWLGSSSECTNPEIMKFYPSSGPREGGTNLTIEGHSLGKVSADVETGLRVAGVPCKLVYYSKASLIKCTTGPSPSPVDGVVEVQVNQRYSARSLLKFSYVDPRIISISPMKGPISGGTRLTVRGEHMNAGTLITASLGRLPCVIISKTKDAVVCVTAPSLQSYISFLEMSFDEATIDYRNQRFVYVDDPTVTEVEPEKAIVSGGGSLTVRGTDLDAIQNPQIYIIYKEKEFYGPCNVTNNITMICWTPAITFGDSYRTRIDVDNPLKVSYGFIMQNRRVVKNQTAPQNPGNGLSGAPEAPQLLIYPDPQFDMFPDEIQFFQTKSGYLTINGRYLNLALKESDVTVRIGKGRCNVTSMALTQLTCRPPDTEPMGLDDEGNPMVTVIVGNMSYPIGRLSYEEDAPGMSLTMILIVSCAGLLLLVIIAAVVLVLCRKTKQSNETVKRLQTQMDILESRVAKECKEAFAELQIDMNELTHDPSGGDRIPFWDYQTFCQRMLFPGWNYSECYPLLDPNMIDLHMRDSIDHGLNQFYGLLKIQKFLLLFIRTLESSPETFTMRDRAKVASYLSVALQSDMDYFTSILQILLAELIKKTVDSKNSAQNAKILFRRSESVAEKMLTNWFAFLLHRFLKECAGEPMYTLFQAIKQQVGKGPVDAVTSEARYSLSEDKLIRQTIDFRTMSLRVLDYNVNYAVQEYQVRVLDCDTISQVKEKILDHIYKATPYSSRPAKEDLELEWQTGVKGHLVIQDEDMSSRIDNDFKRINTLSHYKVPDGACVRFLPKQNSNYNLNMLNEKNSHNYDNTSYVAHSPSRSITPNTISLELETGVKYFHLVKSHDADGGQKEGDRSSKMVSEIYLTRLLSTKGTLQQYVDDLFETIFSTAHRGSSLPLSIKYMFDFLDEQAQLHSISDPETIHTWKSNCLPLRFWVNVIKNPDFVFDVHKSNIVDSCLSVIAQIFMDSCSPKDHVLSKDSPSSKLLYAKDIPKYKKWVERYYQDIKMMPGVSEQDMFGLLQEESRQMHDEYRNTNVKAALNGLYTYVLRYNAPLLRSLDDDQYARANRLPTRLEYVLNQMASQV